MSYRHGANADKVKEAMETAADVKVGITRTTKKGIAATAVNVTVKKTGA